jgi:hypothetical protein
LLNYRITALPDMFFDTGLQYAQYRAGAGLSRKHTSPHPVAADIHIGRGVIGPVWRIAEYAPTNVLPDGMS